MQQKQALRRIINCLESAMDRIDILENQVIPTESVAPGTQELRIAFVNVFGISRVGHSNGGERPRALPNTASAEERIPSSLSQASVFSIIHV